MRADKAMPAMGAAATAAAAAAAAVVASSVASMWRRRLLLLLLLLLKFRRRCCRRRFRRSVPPATGAAAAAAPAHCCCCCGCGCQWESDDEGPGRKRGEGRREGGRKSKSGSETPVRGTPGTEEGRELKRENLVPKGYCEEEWECNLVRWPSLFCASSPWTSISDHKEAAAGRSLSSRISFRDFSKSSLPHKPPRTGRHAKSKSGRQCSHMEFQDLLAVWRKPRTGTFVGHWQAEPPLHGWAQKGLTRFGIWLGCLNAHKTFFASWVYARFMRVEPKWSNFKFAVWAAPASLKWYIKISLRTE